MLYEVIFSIGYTDDLESLTREFKGDVLLHCETGEFYELNIITIDRLRGEFSQEKVCYLENNLIILHRITKENIIDSIKELHFWQFQKRWRPLSQQQVEKYYYPKDDWVIFTVVLD